MRRLLRGPYVLARWLLRALRAALLAIATLLARLLPIRFWLDLRNGYAVIRNMDYAGGAVPIQLESTTECDLRLRGASREPDTVKWIETHFKSGDVFYDIGANVGNFSLIAHRRHAGQVKVYAFEPAFMTFPQLCRNIHLNGAGDAIVPFQVALSDRTALVPFNYHSLAAGSAMHVLGRAVDWSGVPFEPKLSHRMPAHRLDDLVAQFRLPPPNHIKIDVDGTEYDVLLGAAEALKSPTLLSLLIETSDGNESEEDIVRLIVDSGLTLERRTHDNFLYVRAPQGGGGS